jgi:hypothetical protein
MASGRPGPAALECGINVWGRPGEVTPHDPLPVEQPAIDADALRDAAKRLAAAKNPMPTRNRVWPPLAPIMTRLRVSASAGLSRLSRQQPPFHHFGRLCQMSRIDAVRMLPIGGIP